MQFNIIYIMRTKMMVRRIWDFGLCHGFPPYNASGWSLRQPHCTSSAFRIFENRLQDIKTIFMQQLPVLCWCQTWMIQRLPLKHTNGFAITGATGKHQYRFAFGMRCENRKHPALVISRQMEKTIASKHPLFRSRYVKSEERWLHSPCRLHQNAPF